MRVLVVTTWFPSDGRPEEAPFVLEHVRAIARDHDVRVLHIRLGAAGAPTTETYQGIRVRRLPLSPRRPLDLLRAWREIGAAAAKADVVHTMAFSSIGVAAPVLLLRRRPWVHTEHWSGVSDPRSVGGLWPRLAGARRLLRLPDRLTAVSSQLAAVLERFGRPGAVRVVPCVVDNRAPITAAPFGERIELIAVGGLVTGKRPLLAVETLAWLVAHGHDARLTWLGSGPLRDETAALACDRGISDRLALAGRVAPEQVYGRISAADLFFLPTAGETFLASAAEALSCGRAVVLPSTGGFVDFVDACNGELVDDATPEAFGTAIVRAFGRFASVAPEVLAEPIRKRFDPQVIGDEFDALYREVVPR